jgi:NAD(P)-dependent dehydrogenase (short-subunit alcohol dehydrogenase family)
MTDADRLRVLVVGGATGMGAATAGAYRDAGAELTVLDFADVPYETHRAVQVDLSNRSSIDAAIGQLEGRYDVVQSCAGLASRTPGMHEVNFLGQRHLLESLVERELLGEGSAIAMIASIAGRGWDWGSDLLDSYVTTADFEEGERWLEEHRALPEVSGASHDYRFSKQAVCAYVARRSFDLYRRGIRINAVMPGIIDTGLARASNWIGKDSAWLDALRAESPGPDVVVEPLVFLCSPGARYVTGATLMVDAGYVNYRKYDAGLERATPLVST